MTDFKYYCNTKDNIIITRYNGPGGNVIIPELIDNKPVTRISIYAFFGCKRLTSITIPNSVTSIGYYAFSYCTSLESITIPDSVSSIEYGAFKNCHSLTTPRGYYKAFNKDLTCLGYQFKENEWSKPVDNPSLCNQGYHFCTNLFDIFNYYWVILTRTLLFMNAKFKACQKNTGKTQKESVSQLSQLKDYLGKIF